MVMVGKQEIRWGSTSESGNYTLLFGEYNNYQIGIFLGEFDEQLKGGNLSVSVFISLCYIFVAEYISLF